MAKRLDVVTVHHSTLNRSYTKLPIEYTLEYYTHTRARGEIIFLKETEMLIRTKRKSIAGLANVRDKKKKK